MAPVGAFHFFASVKKTKPQSRKERVAKLLEDHLSLQRCTYHRREDCTPHTVSRDCTPQVEEPVEAASTSSTLAVRSSEAQLEEASKRSLALTSEGCYAKEALVHNNGRQEARNLSQLKVTTSHDNGDEARNLDKQPEQTHLVSLVPGDAQNMLTDMDVPRSLSPTKRQGRGGC